MKKKVISWTVKGIVLFVIIGTFFVINKHIDKQKLCSFSFIEDNNAYAYQVEKVYLDNEDVVISGWFFELKCVRNVSRDVNDNDFGIVLYDLNSVVKENIDGTEKKREGIALSVEKGHIRNDVNNYYKCEYDYSSCGFIARINKNEIDYENGEYQIVFKPDFVGNDGLNTSAFLDHGNLIYTTPKNFIPLDVEGTDLEEIVYNGYCVANNPQFHICVYQYGRVLYWIADEEYSFNEDGTYIQYHIDTTQFEKLPAERTERGWFWSTLGANFEDYEITDAINCGKYRVSSREIPEEYSATFITTGYHTDRWIWMCYIRPLNLYK